ncbi:ABC transporter ATP-binding protein [Kiloniella sp.]|uniref:ABC transporter ATP-binding protein n=1 Tax=Kiloniella sp. TaxID=1938587 RepID=UPI003A92D580
MLIIQDMTVGYREKKVLEKVSFSLRPCEFTIVLGANGTGKSSLLKAVSGLIPSLGSIRWDDGAEQRRNPSIAYMPQDTGGTSSLTVMEVILLGRLKSLGLSIPNDLLDEAYNNLKIFGLESLSIRTLDELSGGQRQLVYLAQALFRLPEVLLLDEPTAALDLRHQLIVLDKVSKYCKNNKTITVAAMHDISLAGRYADRLICLKNGKIIADGSPKKVLSQSLIQDLYGVQADLMDGGNGTLHITPLYAV